MTEPTPCRACNGSAGTYIESTREAVDNNGKTVTVHSSTWKPCGSCGGTGQARGGH